jgi:hypothetical protein
MILLLLWAFAGVILGYEAARHGVVQIVVPTLYLFGMFLWLIVGLALLHFVVSRKQAAMPTPQQIRDAYAQMNKAPRAVVERKEQTP